MAPFVEVARSVAVGSLLVKRMSYRDNRVHFEAKNGIPKITSGQFTIESLSITDGQDPQGRNQCGQVVPFNPGNQAFSFSVGRKGKEQARDWFNGQLSRSQHTFNNSPGKLNFGFRGTLVLNLPINAQREMQDIHFYETVLAQGPYGLSNIWYFGGKHCSPDGEHRVKCIGSTKHGWVRASFRRGGNDANTVQVTGVTYEERSPKPNV